MRRISIILICSLCYTGLYAQTYQDINRIGLKKNITAMKISGAWSGVSMLSGGIGYLGSDDHRWKAFHATNFAFGALNSLVVLKGTRDLKLGLSSNLTLDEVKTQHKKIERLYIFNNGFNYAFIFGGLFLKEKGNSFENERKKKVYHGIGEGLITQGIFFLIFDTTMYFAQKKFNDKEFSTILPDELSVGVSQLSFKWNLN